MGLASHEYNEKSEYLLVAPSRVALRAVITDESARLGAR